MLFFWLSAWWHQQAFITLEYQEHHQLIESQTVRYFFGAIQIFLAATTVCAVNTTALLPAKVEDRTLPSIPDCYCFSYWFLWCLHTGAPIKTLSHVQKFCRNCLWSIVQTLSDVHVATQHAFRTLRLPILEKRSTPHVTSPATCAYLARMLSSAFHTSRPCAARRDATDSAKYERPHPVEQIMGTGNVFLHWKPIFLSHSSLWNPVIVLRTDRGKTVFPRASLCKSDCNLWWQIWFFTTWLLLKQIWNNLE